MLRIHKAAVGEPLLFPPSSPAKQVNLASGTCCLHATSQNHTLRCASQWEPTSPAAIWMVALFLGFLPCASQQATAEVLAREVIPVWCSFPL